MKRPPRIITAKPGLDGHDKGVRLVSMALRDAGVDVTYLGLRQNTDSIIAAAKEKQADYIGLSILSGTHLDVARKMLERLAAEQMGCKLIIGGVIPQADARQLLEMGVSEVFPVGSTFASVNEWIMANYDA